MSSEAERRGPPWLPSPPIFLGLVLTLTLTAPFLAVALAAFGRYVGFQLLGAVYHADFLNYYSAARMFLEQPYNLYFSTAEIAFQRNLAGGADVYDQFWSPPQLALLYVPFALLPYGLAYLTWAVINLGLLGVSAHLLAPPLAGRNMWWLWTVGALTFLPVQQALVDGQTPFLLLCGFCVFARLRALGQPRAPMALLTWGWKVQLLPLLLVALVLDRRWRSATVLVMAQVVVSGAVIAWAGVEVLQRYIQLARTSSEQTALRLSPPGQTLLGLAQSALGVGPVALAAALCGAVVVVLLVGALWWRGLRQDARQKLQLALLPVAAILTGTRAGTYELTLWLASAWLVLRYAREVPRRRPFLLTLVFIGWWGGDLATLAERTTGFEWGALAGLVILASLAWLMRADAAVQSSATSA